MMHEIELKHRIHRQLPCFQSELSFTDANGDPFYFPCSEINDAVNELIATGWASRREDDCLVDEYPSQEVKHVFDIACALSAQDSSRWYALPFDDVTIYRFVFVRDTLGKIPAADYIHNPYFVLREDIRFFARFENKGRISFQPLSPRSTLKLNAGQARTCSTTFSSTDGMDITCSLERAATAIARALLRRFITPASRFWVQSVDDLEKQDNTLLDVVAAIKNFVETCTGKPLEEDLLKTMRNESYYFSLCNNAHATVETLNGKLFSIRLTSIDYESAMRVAAALQKSIFLNRNDI